MEKERCARHTAAGKAAVLKIGTLRHVFAEYRRWKGHWDDLCNRCGQCCCSRHLTSTGEVVVDYTSHCENLDETTHLCRVFANRFQEYSHCGRVDLAHALFHPSLPPDCAYVQTFRVWKKEG